MSETPSRSRRLLKAAIFAMALLGVGGIAGIAITGIERVQLGPGRKAFHSAWLVEFHWPAMLLFLLLLAGAIAGTVWLCRRALPTQGSLGARPTQGSQGAGRDEPTGGP